MTEVMNTYAPQRLAVLNANPVTALMESIGCASFRTPNAFHSEDYASFNMIVDEVRRANGFSSMAQADHFLNFVYWLEAKKKKEAKKTRVQELFGTVRGIEAYTENSVSPLWGSSQFFNISQGSAALHPGLTCRRASGA